MPKIPTFAIKLKVIAWLKSENQEILPELELQQNNVTMTLVDLQKIKSFYESHGFITYNLTQLFTDELTYIT